MGWKYIHVPKKSIFAAITRRGRLSLSRAPCLLPCISRLMSPRLFVQFLHCEPSSSLYLSHREEDIFALSNVLGRRVSPPYSACCELKHQIVSIIYTYSACTSDVGNITLFTDTDRLWVRYYAFEKATSIHSIHLQPVVHTTRWPSSSTTSYQPELQQLYTHMFIFFW